jgi:hypothetical protein
MIRSAGIKGILKGLQLIPDPLGTDDGKRAFPFLDQGSFEQHERDATVMVPMEMAYEDPIDIVAGKPVFFELDQRGGTTVDKESMIRRAHVKASVGDTPAPESISAAQHFQLDG